MLSVYLLTVLTTVSKLWKQIPAVSKQSINREITTWFAWFWSDSLLLRVMLSTEFATKHPTMYKQPRERQGTETPGALQSRPSSLALSLSTRRIYDGNAPAYHLAEFSLLGAQPGKFHSRFNAKILWIMRTRMLGGSSGARAAKKEDRIEKSNFRGENRNSRWDKDAVLGSIGARKRNVQSNRWPADRRPSRRWRRYGAIDRAKFLRRLRRGLRRLHIDRKSGQLRPIPLP